MKKRHYLAAILAMGLGVAFFAQGDDEAERVDRQSHLIEAPSQAKKSPKAKREFRSLARSTASAPASSTRAKTKTLAEELDELERIPGRVPVKVSVVDYEEEFVNQALLQSRDCRVYSRVNGGSTIVQMPEDSECTIRAGRRDGMLMAWSEWVKIDTSTDEEVYLDVPSEKTAGMGISIGKHPEGMLVFRVVAGSPAETAGLMAGDIILELDGHDATALNVEDFVRIGTGPIGTDVELIVSRPTGEGSEDFSLMLTRALLKRQRGA